MTITRGRTYEAASTLRRNGAGYALGPSEDLKLVVKWKPTDEDTAVVFTCSTAAGDGVTFSGAAGEYVLKISSEKSSLLPLSPARLNLWYELIFITPPEAYTVDSGRLYVQPALLLV
jgi:hypothetical protein